MRIIAGEAKGRKIESTNELSTRPSSDMTREAVFGALQFKVPGSNFLDVFSGSGAFALEAISRGANRVVCNDFNPKSIDIITKNAEKLGFKEKLEIKQMDYKDLFKSLARYDSKFDIVFLDPPYDSDFLVDCADKLLDSGILKNSATIVVECKDSEKISEIAEAHKSLENTKNKRYGKTHVAYFVYKGE